jgi:hypothetical protein
LAIASVFVSANSSAAAEANGSTATTAALADLAVANDAARAQATDWLGTVRPYARTAPVLDEDSALLLATKDIPEFGGLWLDDTPDGPVVTLALTAPRTQAAGLTASLTRALDAAGRSTVAIPSARALADGTATVRTVEVRYSFAELKQWQATLDPLFEQGIITLTDADERNNKVTVGVANPAHRAAVTEYAVRNGIPADALMVVEAIATPSLRDRHRPVVGGQQIGFLIPIEGPSGPGTTIAYCTLGIPATIVNTTPEYPGYLTNSHCSIEYAQPDYVEHWQPNVNPFSIINTTNRIGYEVIDPPLFTGNPHGSADLSCPSGYQCRLSDMGFGAFNSPHASTPRGYIARPGSLGTLNWNGTDKYRITATSYPTGTVRAVGRTSGMSAGTITLTCFRVGIVDIPDVLQNCQYAGTYSSQPGDSGSPVFRVTDSPSTNDVTFVGLNWGSLLYNGVPHGVVSAWPLALVDFYPYDIRVCAAGFTC